MTESQVSYEEDDDDTRDSDSADTLDRMLENYTFSFEPEIRFKWSKRVKDLSINAAYTKRWRGPWEWRLVLKPDAQQLPRWGRCIRKVLVVPSAAVVAMSTQKLHLGALRLQFDLFYNVRDKRFGLDYRWSTKFSDGPRISTKYQYQPTAGVTLRAKHYINWVPPTMSGHFGTDPADDAQDLDVRGKFDMEITQLDFKFELP